MQICSICCVFLLLAFNIPRALANSDNVSHLGVFVSSKTFEGKDLSQKTEYETLIQRLSAHSTNFTVKTYPIKNISNDALILAKAALDQVQTMVILRKVSPNYTAVSLWDVQNFEIIGESAFENMGNQKLINDFYDWLTKQDYKQFRSEAIDAELFSLQLIDQKQCKLLKKYLPKTKLDETTQSKLEKNCSLKESFGQLLSGKRTNSISKASSPAQIKIVTQPHDEKTTQIWVELIENSILQQNIGRYDISSLSFVIECLSDDCMQIDLTIDIVSYIHMDFRSQYRLANSILRLMDQAKRENVNLKLTSSTVTFYEEYTPINTFNVSGSADAPNIVSEPAT